ncbi:MAG: Gfo/Idh/MocA family oxidoreductase [Desulfobacterales bacterium]
MTVRMALIGTGYISKIHAQAAQVTPGVKLEAAVGLLPESLAAFSHQYGIERQYKDLDALLKDGDVDAIVIGTPNYLHAPQSIKALEAGAHVMVEKPMAMSVQEAQAMQAASEINNRLLMVAHCWRYDAEVLWMHEQLQAGKLGRLIRTKGYGVHTNWGPSGWFTQSQMSGGGALVDMGVHAIDTARFLLGDPPPVSVYARIGTYYKEYDVDDTGVIFINWENGTTSYIESGWWQPHMDGPEASTQLYGTSGFGQVFPTYLELPDSEDENGSRTFQVDPGFAPVREPHCLQSMYDTQMNHFIGCIQNGQKPKTGPSIGIINMCILEAAYESARSGEVVKL